MMLPIALFFVSIVGLAAQAQTLQPVVLHNFVGSANLIGPLVEGPDGKFYSTTQSGGSAGRGTVFKMTSAGTMSTLVEFTGPNGHAPSFAGLTLGSDGNLYGMTQYGGSGGRGTLFKVALAGELTTLVNFNNTNGSGANGLTTDSDGSLYGTTVTGTNYHGTVYKVATDGTFRRLVDFPANYGSFPAGLTLGHDGSLYGRTYNGLSEHGTVFRVTTDGTLTTLASLSGCSHAYSTALAQGNDGNFYGTTINGGSSRRGTAFRMTPEGQLTTLVNFNGTNGMLPAGPLILGGDGNFYGTTIYGGIFEGTVFKMTPEGALTTLAHFPSRDFGVRPYAGVTFGADGSLYGTTVTGGSRDGGIFFRLDLPPTIVSPPSSRTNSVDTTATFMVAAFGTQPFNYQWLKNGRILMDGGNVSGASTAMLTLANVQATDAGDFAVVVNNVAGSAMSSAAALAVEDGDTDGDGVPNDQDQCAATAAGAVVDVHGCSIEQLVPCKGPPAGGIWRNHGEYVAAVARVVRQFVAQGLLSEQEGQAIVAAAGKSNCGNQRKLKWWLRK